MVWRREAAGMWQLEAVLRAPAGGDAHSEFGAAVATDGDRVAVGNPIDRDAQGRSVGAVYVFRRSGGASGGTWTLEQRLTNPGPDSAGNFGRAVALSGETLVVGPTTTAGAGEPRAAAHFRRNAAGGAWDLRQILSPIGSPAPWANDFGAAIAMAQNRVAIGAPLEIAGDGRRIGAVYIFERNGAGEFQQIARIDGPAPAPTPDFGERFGAALAFDGSTVLAGAPDRLEGQVRIGRAYIFKRTSGVAAPWTLSATLTPSDRTSPGGFGTTVALAAGWAAVGSPLAQMRLEGGSFRGCAELYQRAGDGTWAPSGRRTTLRPGPAGGDSARAVGTSIAIALDGTGNAVLVLGAPESWGGLPNAGTVDLLPITASITDCTGNGLPDSCEIAAGVALDLNNNGVPDLCCPADIDGNGAVSVEDVFGYLFFYFRGMARADVNRAGGVTVQDLFEFLAAYFGGRCA